VIFILNLWNNVWPYLVAILLFLILIIIHEFGHFIAAKLMGVRVNEFAVGFGPRLFSKKLGETNYAFNLVPLGGYCAMEGEDEESADGRAFCNKKPWRRFIIVVMGATFNLLLGLIIVAIILAPEKLLATTVISRFEDGSLSDKSGLMVNDEILSVDGRTIYAINDLGYAFTNVADGKLDMTVLRDGKEVDLKDVAFKPEKLENTFGDYIASKGYKQLRIAETEKYAHVTFFFNGGVEEPNEGETRILVNSPKEVATYDLKPEMSAYGVCDKLVEAIKSGSYDVIVINFANPDMVGHTGVQDAAIKAVEAVDECVGKAVEAIKEVDGVMFICADHGNAEQLVDYETGEPFTAHTTNPVPFILVNYKEGYGLREGGCLADIVPTLIEIMGKEQPVEMTGKSLLIQK